MNITTTQKGDPDPSISFRYRLLAWASFIGMFLVLIAGAIVTKTGSGRGCGDDWPLCNGKFIPAYTLESIIEYSHRMVTGIVGLIILATFIYTWRYLRRYREAVAYAGGTLFFTVVQAFMGAAAVIWPQRPAVMAIHFGISLLAVASSMLLVVWTYRMKKTKEDAVPIRFPKAIYLMAWGIWIYCYGVVYLGAYIRHTHADAGCMGWPLCNGQVIPTLSGASGIVFLHRVAAAVLLILIVWLYLLIRRHDSGEQALSLNHVAGLALLFVIAQVFSGAWLTLTMNNEDIYIFTSLLHNVLATLLFSALTDISIRSWKFRAR
jgi:cytochrome c oxidase assembly protein subunit 15